jgi:hypothetical protein
VVQAPWRPRRTLRRIGHHDQPARPGPAEVTPRHDPARTEAGSAVTAGRVHGGLSADIRVHEREASSILDRASEYWVVGRDGAGLRSGLMVDRAVLDVIEREIADEVRTRFPGDAVQRVRLLQYGDHPMIEPGDLWVWVMLAGDPEDYDLGWAKFVRT